MTSQNIAVYRYRGISVTVYYRRAFLDTVHPDCRSRFRDDETLPVTTTSSVTYYTYCNSSSASASNSRVVILELLLLHFLRTLLIDFHPRNVVKCAIFFFYQKVCLSAHLFLCPSATLVRHARTVQDIKIFVA